MQSLYDYDCLHNPMCEHDFNNPIRESGTRVEVKVLGDCFVQEVTCKKCGVDVDVLFNNKHPEYLIRGKY